MKLKPIKQKLSKYLPTAIRQAVADVRAVLKDERYRFDIFNYHQPSSGTCAVCVAGAVIARRGGASPRRRVMPCYMPNEAEMLHAIDRVLREGHWPATLYRVGLELKPGRRTKQPCVPDWSCFDDADTWCAHALRVADWLEKNTVRIGGAA